MKYIIKFFSVVLSIFFIISLSSCGADISDPLAKNPELMNNTTNNWMPILEKEKCMNTMGLGDSEDTLVITNNRSVKYKYNLYYLGYYTFGNQETKQRILMRYDLRTGESYPACRDSACLHRDESCPFYIGNLNAYITNKNMLYMLKCETKDGHVDTSEKGGIYSYNLDTLEYKLIAEYETGAANFFGYYDNKLYYVQNEYQDKLRNEHDKYIWSCDIKTGKTEKLFCYGDETDKTNTYQGRFPLVVDGKGRLIFINYVSFDPLNLIYDAPADKSTVVFEYAELKKNAKIVTVAEYESKFSEISRATLQYFDGKLYFNEFYIKESITYTTNETERIQTFNCMAINSVDIDSGEVRTLVNKSISGFAIAGKYLYYFPFEPRVVEYGEGKAFACASKGYVIQKDLTTGEEKKFVVKGEPKLGHGYTYYYHGRLFTYGVFVNNDNQLEEYEIEIDLVTGEYRRIPRILLQTG